LFMGGFIFDEVAGTALTENDAAAARIDAKRSLVGVIEDATTRGQRAAVSAAGRLSVDASGVAVPVTDNSGSLTVDAPIGAPVNVKIGDGSNTATLLNPGDNVSNTAGLPVVAFLQGYDGSTYDRLRVVESLVGDAASGTGTLLTASLLYNGTTWDRPRTVAVGDAAVATGIQAAGLMGYNGTTWDRVRTANTGRLQVDVVTASSTAVTNAGTFAVQDSQVVADNAAFTDGTSKLFMGGFIFDETAGTALTENDAAAARVDSKRSLVGVIEDATTRGQRAAVSAGGALKVDGSAATQPVSGTVTANAGTGTFTVDSELPAAAALADATSNPTVPGVGGFLLGYNGTTWDRVRTANTGRLQIDVVTAPSTAVTNAGTFAVQATLSAETTKVIGTVNQGTSPWVVDTEFPTAAALGDAAANPTTPSAGALLSAYNGTTWDRLRTLDAIDAAPNVRTGLLATGVGPGFDIKFNPANLGTATNSAITNTVDGANLIQYAIGTSTTGTYTFEVSADDSGWVAATFFNAQTGATASGNITPTSGDVYAIRASGYRQVRVRTVSTLGVTVAVKTTHHLGNYWQIVGDGGGSLTVDSPGLPTALGQSTMANSMRVVIASDQTVVPISDNAGSLTVDAPVGTPLAARLSDGTSFLTTTSGRLAVDGSGVTQPVSGTITANAGTGTFAVDTELPAAAALADATSNPTVPGVGGFLLGYNGTTWDRVRTANTGRLQVDVITAAATAVTNAGTFAVQDSQVIVDNAGFTDGTSKVFMSGFIFDETAGTALTENDAAAARIDSKRSLVGVIEDATTRGQRAAVSAAGRLSVDASGVAIPITDNAGSLTVDAPVGTPVAARLSDGTAFLTTTGGRLSVDASGVAVPITDNSGSLTVDNAGTFAVQDSEKIVDNAGFTDGTSKLMMGGFIFDETAGTALTENDAAAGRVDSKRAQVLVLEDATTRGQRAAISAAGRISVDASGVAVPITDNAGSLTVDAPVATPVFVRLSDGTTALTTTSGALSVDTELPAAVALSDVLSNPTTPLVGSALLGFNSGAVRWERLDITAPADAASGSQSLLTYAKNQVFNGTTWDRMRGDTTNGVDVDVTRMPKTSSSTVTQVASSATTVTLKASNTARTGLMVFNDSTQILYVKLGATASTTSYTVQVQPKGYYELPASNALYTGVVDAIWASANGNAYVTELA
jgi:hypothetical protein